MSSTICIIAMGKAATGKTTFVNCLREHLVSLGNPPFLINLDPAVRQLPYTPMIDIRNKINYKDVMTEYGMGPNGAIVTALNLFTTTFNQVMEEIERRADHHNFIIVDTPGQIEVYDRSASGTIITESLASKFPTIIAFLVDTPRASNPNSFIIDMLYASSILNKYKMPLVITFNKTDLHSADFVGDWVEDFTKLQSAMLEHDESYRGTLSSSLCLALEEFYRLIPRAAVSSATGDGLGDFLKAVDSAAEEYKRVYKSRPSQLKVAENQES